MIIDVITEQRHNIKFLVKLGKSPQEITDMLNSVYGDRALKKTSIFKWVKRFKDGREDAQDNARPGRPSTSCIHENIHRVRSLILNDHRKSVRMIAEELNLRKSTVHRILTQYLGKKVLCKNCVQHAQAGSNAENSASDLPVKEENPDESEEISSKEETTHESEPFVLMIEGIKEEERPSVYYGGIVHVKEEGELHIPDEALKKTCNVGRNAGLTIRSSP